MKDAISPKTLARIVSTAEPGVVAFLLGDVVSLRRAHPCGGHEWLVDRLGADVGLRCTTCGRHVLLERRSLERRLIGFVSRGNAAMSRAVGPAPRDNERLRGGAA
jgi:hypothetical protein